MTNAKLVHLRPTEHDTDDYTAIEVESGMRFALTPTCAANLLGIIPDDAFAKGNSEAARAAFKPLAEKISLSVEDAARKVLEISCRKVEKQIEELINEYNLDRQTVELIGGGGGAASLIPFTGQLMNLPARLARKAEVISTIGVALAMVRDTIERNITNPTPEQILQMRREAQDAVIKIGALPESVEVQIEVDTRRNLVRATAFGTTELKKDDDAETIGGLEGARMAAARSMKIDESEIFLAAETAGFYVFAQEVKTKTFFGIFTNKRLAVRVVDKTGVVRLQRNNAEVHSSPTCNTAPRELEAIINKLTDFGDAGRALPDIHLLAGARIVNLSGLAELEQVIALAETELENYPVDERNRDRRLAEIKWKSNELQTDVLIVGGGVGGCAAALAACENGLNVILTEESDWIGGQFTSQATPPDEHGWIEEFGCTRSYRNFRNSVRDYYRNNFPLTEDGAKQSGSESGRRLGFAAVRRAERFSCRFSNRFSNRLSKMEF